MRSARTIIAIAVIRHEGRILIARRQEGEALAGYWEFPGGKVQAGETPREAALRECREELGCVVEVGSLLLSVDHDYEHGALRLLFHEATLKDRYPPPDITREWKFVTPGELHQYRFPPANERILEMLTQPVQKTGG